MSRRPRGHSLTELVDLDTAHDALDNTLGDIANTAGRDGAEQVDLDALTATSGPGSPPAPAPRRFRSIKRRPLPRPDPSPVAGSPAGNEAAPPLRAHRVVLRLVAAALIIAVTVAVVVYFAAGDQPLQFTRS